jgi:hypothetical protein
MRVRMGTWGRRLVKVLVVGSAAIVFGVLVLAEGFGIDLEPTIRRLAATTGLGGRQALYLAMGVVFAVIGVETVATRGAPALGRAVTLAQHDPVRVGEVHLETGTVEVEGHAEPMTRTGTIEAPYSGTECLGYRCEAKERRRRASDDDSEWRVVETAERAVPFTVTDDSGSVTVDPDGATPTFDRDIVTSTGGRTETEWRLEPGESVYVSGWKCDGASGTGGPGGAATYLGAGEDAAAFTVSDAAERRTVLRFLAKGVLLSGAGLMFAGLGVALLYFGVV